MTEATTSSSVLVVYETSPAGRDALLHAADVARARKIPLVVLAAAPQARVDGGCLRCRGSAGLWNLAMIEVAEEELQEARELLAAGAEPKDVHYVVGRGEPLKAITATAAQHGADCVVVPSDPASRLPLPRRRSLASRLGTNRPFTVVCPPTTR